MFCANYDKFNLCDKSWSSLETQSIIIVTSTGLKYFYNIN